MGLGGLSEAHGGPHHDHEATGRQQDRACDSAAAPVIGRRTRYGHWARCCRDERGGGRCRRRNLGWRQGSGASGRRHRLAGRCGGYVRGPRSRGGYGRAQRRCRHNRGACCRGGRRGRTGAVRGCRADERRYNPSDRIAGGGGRRQCRNQRGQCQHQGNRNDVAGPPCGVHPVHRRGRSGPGRGPGYGRCPRAGRKQGTLQRGGSG